MKFLCNCAFVYIDKQTAINIKRFDWTFSRRERTRREIKIDFYDAQTFPNFLLAHLTTSSQHARASSTEHSHKHQAAMKPGGRTEIIIFSLCSVCVVLHILLLAFFV